MIFNALWEDASATSSAFPWGFGGMPTQAGPRVDEHEALTLPAVFRAVDLLASHLAMLPLPVFRTTGPDSRERLEDHPVHRLLNIESNPELGAFEFRRAQVLHTILWGNDAQEGKEIRIAGLNNPTILTISYSDVEGGQSSCSVGSNATLIYGTGMIVRHPPFVLEAEMAAIGAALAPVLEIEPGCGRYRFERLTQE